LERCLKIPLLVFLFKARGTRRPCKERCLLTLQSGPFSGVEGIIHAHACARQMPGEDVLRETVPQCKVRAKLEHR
jgi:hypothetical protein